MAKDDIKRKIEQTTKKRNKARKDFKEKASTKVRINEPICYSCLHFLGEPICRAFPEGIPKDILDGENDHAIPVEGDNDIQYEEYSEIKFEKLMRDLQKETDEIELGDGYIPTDEEMEEMIAEVNKEK